jgi:hypothetical protein
MTTVAKINLPSWGNIFVCKLPDDVRLAISECLGKLKTRRRKLEALAKLVARCTIDENLQRVFTDDDWEALARKPETELAHVFKIACQINLIENPWPQSPI